MNESRLNYKIKKARWAASRANAALNNLSPADVDAIIEQYLLENLDNLIEQYLLENLDDLISQYLLENHTKTVKYFSGTIAAGASGTILTDTAPSGKSFIIKFLLTDTGLIESGLSLIIDGVTLFSNNGLLSTSPSTATGSTPVFGISTFYENTLLGTAASVLKEVHATTFSVVKDAGSTVNSIDYSYQTIEVL
jgi:hypothetical protein